MKIVTKSARETKEFAEKLAHKILGRKHSKHAYVLALAGELGAGKTTFVQGFFKGLGIKVRATSPTFIIFRRHSIPSYASHGSKVISYKSVFHMDAYRLSGDKDLAPLGFEEIINDPKNILLVEWAGNIRNALPGETKWIEFSHGKKASERVLTL